MAIKHSLLLEVEGRPEGSTLLHLNRIGRGKYKDIIPECISEGLIEIVGKNSIREDLYCISKKGKDYLSQAKE